MNGLDLFTGIGGISKALGDWVRPIAYCENDRYCQGVLLSRMATGDLPISPIWDDVRTLKAALLPTKPEIIYGGFPCQDISVANTSGKGLEGKRSGLFFEIERLVREIRPRFVFLENVPAIRTRGGDVVGARLADAGYDCRWITLSASEIGAQHHRKRWWLLAHANSDGEKRNQYKDREGRRAIFGSEIMADTRRKQERSKEESAQKTKVMFQFGGRNKGEIRERPVESPVCGVAYDVPFRVGKLRALGNSVVPAQAKEAFQKLMFGWR